MHIISPKQKIIFNKIITYFLSIMGFLALILISSFLSSIQSVTTVPPTWVTSDYVRADSRRVINGDACNCKTGNSSTPTSTMPFTTAFASIPNLGYGISNYQGDDGLGQQMVEVNRTSLTATSFSVLVKISGFTHLWVVQVRYIGISKTFPHHLNSFDNVPINYNNGALTNISYTTTAARTYTNTINYSNQAQSIGSSYTTFSLPLSNNKILLFLTSYYISGVNDFTGPPFYALNLQVSGTPISTSSYQLSATYGVNSNLTRLHFSMIVFDQADVQSSGQYKLVYDKISYGSTGGFYAFQSQFLSNFMIGFVQFSTSRTMSIMHFITTYTTVGGLYGALLPTAAPRITLIPPMTRFCFTYFYMKTWNCPNSTFFDPAQQLCTTCPVPNCLTCYNLTTCSVCDQANGYFLHPDTRVCNFCGVGCTSCNDQIQCTSCNETLNYALMNNNVCQLCDISQNFFPDSHTCRQCTIPHCVVCSSLDECQTCNPNNSYYVDSNHECSFCDGSHQKFINFSTGHCQDCSIPHCNSCASLTVCSSCDESSQYFRNPSDNLCYACSIPHCSSCLNYTVCQTCDSHNMYVLNSATGLCQACTITGCKNCSTPTACIQCDNDARYLHISSNNTCQLCPSNMFPNQTSHSCEPCSLSNCLVCVNLTSCSSCDVANAYYLTSSLNCSYCNSTNNYFIDLNILTCQQCNISNCLVCSDLVTCTNCDQINDYFLNLNTHQCDKCSIPGCQDCYNASVCDTCNNSAGYVLNSTTNQCDLCPPGLFPNVTSQQCEPCAVANCTNCSTLTTCSLCDYNNSYYLVGTSCNYCNSSLNYFINLTTLGCELCTPTNCITCNNLTSCTFCNQTADFFLNSTMGLCYACGILGCQDCQNFTHCNLCDSDVGYVLNSTTNVCDLCPTGLFPNITSQNCEACAVANCTNCSALTTCIACDTNNSYYLVNSSCNYCNSSLDFFINMTTLDCQPCSLLQCTNCSSLTQCSTCNLTANYLLNATDNLCYLCQVPNCLTCQTFSTCSVCNTSNGYYLNSSTGTCEECNLTGCSICATLTTCQVCDSANEYGLDFTSPNMSLCGDCNVSCTCDGYGLPWTSISCTPICGDGLIRLGEHCDDNNAISHDGCSSTCNVQIYYNCSGQPSVCIQTLFIQANFISISKQGCNGFKIIAQTPNFSLSQISNNIFIQNSGVNIISIVENGSFIEVNAEYTRDIVNQQILLHFSPGQLLTIPYSPQIPALYYSANQCSVQTQVQTLVKASQYISYAILIASLLSCKIVGLQLFGVLQLSYFSLSSYDFLNMYLSPLAKFKSFNGLNIGIVSQSLSLPNNLSKLGVAGSFINNCNIMVLLIFAQLIACTILYLVSKLTLSQKLQSIALRFLKQGFITLVLFNTLNISFSAGVHWKHANPSDDGYIASYVLLAITVGAILAGVVVMMLTKQGYGQFKQKFKMNWTCQLYIPFTIIYWMALGFYIGVKNDYGESTLIIISFSIPFVMYIIINLPFNSALQNYRCALINATILYILLTTNYYRSMKSTTPMQIKGRLYTPAIVELILVMSCIGLSLIVLAYQIYQLVKQWRQKQRIDNKSMKTQQFTEQSFQNL